MTLCKKILDLLQRFRSREDGIAAVEAGFVMPIMILLYLGSVELSFGIIADRKLTVATQTVADLITQYQVIDDATVDGVYTAASQIMAPYTTTTLGVDVTGITVDAAGTATVAWTEHRGAGTAKHAVNDTVTLPASINTPNSFIVFVEGGYGFNAGTHYFVQSQIDMSDQFYMRPRIADTIVFN